MFEMDITLLCRPLLAADLIALPRSAANIGLLRMSPNLTMQLHEYKFAPQRLNRILSFKMLGIFSRIPRLKSPEPVAACEQPGVPGRWSRLLSVHAAGKQISPTVISRGQVPSLLTIIKSGLGNLAGSFLS